jgi:hypothetical protein
MTEIPQEPIHQIVTTVRLENLLDYLTGRRVLFLPEGTKLLACWQDNEWYKGNALNRRLKLRLEHGSFPALPEGGRIPEIQVPRATVKQIEPEPRRAISKGVFGKNVPSQKTIRRRILVEEETVIHESD